MDYNKNPKALSGVLKPRLMILVMNGLEWKGRLKPQLQWHLHNLKPLHLPLQWHLLNLRLHLRLLQLLLLPLHLHHRLQLLLLPLHLHHRLQLQLY
jgi:hypothetical protein